MYPILLSILFPILAGLFLLIRYRTPLSGRAGTAKRKTLVILTGSFLIITVLLTVIAICTAKEGFTLFYLTETLPVYFRIDKAGTLFSLLAVVVLLCAGFFSFEYMKHEERESRYYGFYLLLFGVLNALCFAGNLITFYLFFELLTLTSTPLVLHTGSKEAVMAGLKYLFYSLCGAYTALFGIYFLYKNSVTLAFTAGGVLKASAIAEHGGFLLAVAFVMILGFGVKAGMFPMHAWLPAAAGAGFGCVVRHDCQSGSPCHYPCRYHVWPRFSSEYLDADRLDLSDSNHGLYGIASGLPGTGAEKKTGLLHG